MKINYLVLVFLLITTFASAQATKKTLELPEFKSIYVNSNYTVYLKQTNKQEVTVEADPEILAATEIKVENGILMINIERKPESPNKSLWAKLDDIKLSPNMKVYVSVRNIAELQVNANGKIISENSIAADYILLGVAGSGSMDVDLKGNTIKAEVTGNGNLTIRGYATSIDAMVSGPGTLNSFACSMETAKVKVSGSGLCQLNVAQNLEALVLGSGQVKHKGNTKNTTRKIYGSGIVERAF
jgi:hypothetical protein